MKCFYHNDLDGEASGFTVAKYEGNNNSDNYFKVDYTMDLTPIIENIKQYERVYFVDYSFTEKTLYILNQLLSKQCEIIWCDHHISSLNLIEKYPLLNKIKGIRREGISGAALTYMYFNNISFKNLPMYIKYISDYDCWKYEYGDYTTYFKLGMDTIPHDIFDNIWNEFIDIDTVFKVIEKGKLIKTYIDLDNKEYLDSYGYESELEGYKCYVINKKTNSWIFGDKINEYPLVIVWVFDGEKYSYSLFSESKEIDCSKIAEKFGGGGHKGAAGFSGDRLLVKKIN
jgi:oligoribonuclease NrnB/cAMP/cGMP phosphodiesterase (DHH superfamily)